MNPTAGTSSGSFFTPRLVLGIGIIVVGILLGLENLDILDAHFVFKLWPLILVAMGVAKLRSDRVGTNVGAWILIGLGIWLLAALLGHSHPIATLWPMILVGLGIFVVVKALQRERGVPPELARHESFVQCTAIFGGCKRRMAVQDFKGGELTAIFGGFEVDLRQCAMEGEQVRVDVFVLFGGGEIHLPPGWEVLNRATAIAGAIEDKTLPALNPSAMRPRLVITGMTLFGGVDLKS